MNIRKHHFLISGTIMFVHNTSKELGSVPLNGVLITDTQKIPAKSLGKAQQILQHNFHKNSGNEGEVTVVDVVLNNFTHLGDFTEEEFNAVPQGMTLKQAQGEVVSAMEAANGSAS